MNISREEMTANIHAGRASRWTHELGRDRLIFAAASLDGTWYAVLDGTGDYQEVPAPFAALLTTLQATLDDEVRGTDSAARSQQPCG